jgi:hypothetical protein
LLPLSASGVPRGALFSKLGTKQKQTLNERDSGRLSFFVRLFLRIAFDCVLQVLLE